RPRISPSCAPGPRPGGGPPRRSTRARASCAPAAPALHDAAVSRRRTRRGPWPAVYRITGFLRTANRSAPQARCAITVFLVAAIPRFARGRLMTVDGRLRPAAGEQHVGVVVQRVPHQARVAVLAGLRELGQRLANR